MDNYIVMFVERSMIVGGDREYVGIVVGAAAIVAAAAAAAAVAVGSSWVDGGAGLGHVAPC